MKKKHFVLPLILVIVLAFITAKTILPGLVYSHNVLSDPAMLSEQEQIVVALPFNTALRANGHSASRRTYCHGNYGISDIGLLRIAVKDVVFSGTSSSSSIRVRSSTKWYRMLLPSRWTSKKASGSGATGTGARRFTYKYGGKRGHTLCTFGGINFSFVDGQALFGNVAVSFKEPTTVFFSSEGQLEKIFRKRQSGVEPQ